MSETESGDRFSIVRGLEPAFTNRAFFVYFFPLTLITTVATFVKDRSLAPLAIILGLWFLGGAIFASSLA